MNERMNDFYDLNGTLRRFNTEINTFVQKYIFFLSFLSPRLVTLDPRLSPKRQTHLNPVVVAKHFEYRVETFFTKVWRTNAKPTGKIVYYVLTAKF